MASVERELNRPLMSVGVASQARGSAYLEFGRENKVLCAVYGPRPNTTSEFSELGRLNCEFRRADFARPEPRDVPRPFMQTEEEKHLSAQLERALEVAVIAERFPKSQFDVHVLVLESVAEDFTMAVNAASLALCDAGVEMYDMVTAVTVGIVNGELLAEPTVEESRQGTATISLAYLGLLDEVTYFAQDGEVPRDLFQRGFQLGLGGCSRIRKLMEECLRRKVRRPLEVDGGRAVAIDEDDEWEEEEEGDL